MTLSLKRWLPLLIFAMIQSVTASVVTVYEQNFENPNNPNCPNGGGSTSIGTFSTDYAQGHYYSQILTTDRLCVTVSPYSDPTGQAGRYSGGFVSSGSWVESWAMSFDPAGQHFLNIQSDWAQIQFPDQAQFDPLLADKHVAFSAYKLPASVLSAATAAGMNPYTLVSQPSGTATRVSLYGGGVATPLQNTTLTIPKNTTGNMYTLQWQTFTQSLDVSSLSPGDQVIFVFNPIDWSSYIAFDNLKITASDLRSAPPGISKTFSPTSVNVGQTATLEIVITGDQINDLPNLNVSDTLPAPLVLNAAPTTTCLNATPIGVIGGNNIGLSGGTLPKGGCKITAEVLWPVSAISACDNTAKNNLIQDTAGNPSVADGFSIGTTPTKGENATATLSCPPTPDLSVSLSLSQTEVTKGTPVTLTVKVSNVGSVTTLDGKVEVPIPSGISLDVASLPADCTLHSTPSLLSCTLSTLAPAAEMTFVASLNTLQVGTYQQIATVKDVSGELPIHFSNNISNAGLGALKVTELPTPIPSTPIPVNAFILLVCSFMAILLTGVSVLNRNR